MCRKRISCCNVHCHRICNKYFTTLLLLRTILNGLAASHRRPKRLHYKRWKFETLTLFGCLHDIHCGQCDLIFRNFTILGKILSLWKNYRMVYFVFSTLLYLPKSFLQIQGFFPLYQDASYVSYILLVVVDPLVDF